MGRALVTVAEAPVFAVRAATLLTVSERDAVIEMVARDPECGAVIPGTGGVRKVRIALAGRGKSGGARVIYYFQNEQWPIILLAIYAKNERSNLSAAERNDLAGLVSDLKKARATKGNKS